MKSLKVMLTIAFVVVSICCLSQHKTTGILILTPTRDHMAFDLFVPGTIDITKSLKGNLSNLKDTAIRFATYKEGLLKPSMLKHAVRMVNESPIKGAAGEENVLVLPVEAEYEDEDFSKLLPDEFYNYEVIFYGYLLVKVYDNKKPIFKRLRTLKLPKDGRANTDLPK